MLSREDQDLAYGDSLPEAQAQLADNPTARRVLEEAGDQDISAADFFELYAEAIEHERERREAYEAQVPSSVRHELRELLDYFEWQSSEDITLWPQWGLRSLAMLAPIYVASGILGPSEEDLERALKTKKPYQAWGWWRGLGQAIFAGVSDKEVAATFDLSPRLAARYRHFLMRDSEKQAA